MRLGTRRNSRHFDKHIRSQSGQEIAEFGAVLWIVLFVIFFPFVDIVLYFAGYGVLYITCNLAARAAAPTFTGSAAQTAYTNMLNSPFLVALGAATHTTPSGTAAYQLSVLRGSDGETPSVPSSTKMTPVATAPFGTISNVPPPAGVFFLYQVSTVSGMTMSPIFPIPMLGVVAVPVNLHATCFVEHPEGLNN